MPTHRHKAVAINRDDGFDTPALLAGVGLTLAFLALYLRTAARSIVVGDNPELVTAAVTLGVAHPPGYPLLTILGHLFSYLPLAPVPFRLNVLAALCGAGTMALVYLSAWCLTRSWPAAVIAAAALGLNPLFWSWSLAFEAFSLNNFLTALLVYLVVLWNEQRWREGYLVAAAFVGGLGMANHQTLGLLAPAVVCLCWRQLLRSPRLLAACLVAAIAGLLPYAYIPWAAAGHPFQNWGDVSSLQDLVALVTRADYGTIKLAVGGNFAGGSPLSRLFALMVSFLPVEAPLLVLGAVECYRRSRAVFWFFAVGFLVTGPAFAAYANMNLSKETALFVMERFFLLSHVLAAPVTAFGAVAVSRLFIKVAGQRLAYPALGLCALGSLVVPAVVAFPRIDQSGNYVAERYAQDVLDSLPPNSILLANSDEHCFPVMYLQGVMHKRSDVSLVLPGLLNGRWYIRQLQARFPELHVRPDNQSGLVTVKSLIEANPGRYIGMTGPFDDSLKTGYGLVFHGLIGLPQPLGQSLDFVAIVEKNEALMKQYHFPSPARINRQTYEVFLVQAYARPSEWIASQYRDLKLNKDAATWYRRALVIDPEYPNAKEGLEAVTE